MRSSKSTRRALALTTAVGVLALTGPTLPAAAQPSTEPPELDPNQTPASGPLSPKGDFEQQQGCMGSNPGNSQIKEKPWSQLSLGFEQAHDRYTGAGQKIAVIDTGINRHPRLQARLVDEGGSAVPKGDAFTDCDGHGTIVAGIAAASENPQTGFVGVAPDSQLMSIRQSSSLWESKSEDGKTIGDTQTMAQAIQYAVDRGASVINISQASCQSMAEASNPNDPYNQQLHNAVKNAYEQNIVVVTAAGNTQDACQQNAAGDPSTAVLPAWFDEYVLTVASVNQQGAPSDFTVAGPWVDVAAPGENLISLDPGQGGNGLASQISTGPDGQPAPIQGTSFAAPYVSGLVALMKEKYGNQLTAKQIMERIKTTALHPGGENGRNDSVGYGMIDPMAALDDVVPAEHNAEPAQSGPTRLEADVIPNRDWPSILIAFGGSLGGIGAVVFTAFLINARRSLRARRASRE